MSNIHKIDHDNKQFYGKHVAAGTLIPANYICLDCRQKASACKCHVGKTVQSTEGRQVFGFDVTDDTATDVTARLSVTFQIQEEGRPVWHSIDVVCVDQEEGGALQKAVAIVTQLAQEKYGVEL